MTEADEAKKAVKSTAEPQDDWVVETIGTILRHATDRCLSLQIVNNRYLITCGSKSSEIEIFVLSTPEEIVKKQKKRLKKNPEDEPGPILRDLVRRLDSVKASEGRIKSIDAYVDKSKRLQVGQSALAVQKWANLLFLQYFLKMF